MQPGVVLHDMLAARSRVLTFTVNSSARGGADGTRDDAWRCTASLKVWSTRCSVTRRPSARHPCHGGRSASAVPVTFGVTRTAQAAKTRWEPDDRGAYGRASELVERSRRDKPVGDAAAQGPCFHRDCLHRPGCRRQSAGRHCDDRRMQTTADALLWGASQWILVS